VEPAEHNPRASHGKHARVEMFPLECRTELHRAIMCRFERSHSCDSVSAVRREAAAREPSITSACHEGTSQERDGFVPSACVGCSAAGLFHVEAFGLLENAHCGDRGKQARFRLICSLELAYVDVILVPNGEKGTGYYFK